MMNGLYSIPDYSPVMPRAYGDYLWIRRTQTWHGGIRLLTGIGLPMPLRRKALDMMSVRWYAALSRMPRHKLAEVSLATGGSFQKLGGGVEILERREALPRAYVVNRVIRVPSRKAALARILSAKFKPRREAVVIDASAAPGIVFDLTSPKSPRDGAGAGEAVRIRSLTTAGVEIEASCEARCLLVLTDLHYPGWQAWVDGRPQEILRANGIFRGLLLEPGRHDVVYRYRPASIRIGYAALALSLVASGGLAAHAWRRSRRLDQNRKGASE